MKKKLSQIRSPWHRLRITFEILFFYCRDNFINRRGRASYHWLGKRSRLQRPERAFIVLMFSIAIILLEPYEYAVWATVIGGFTAMMVPVISVRYLLRAHWVR